MKIHLVTLIGIAIGVTAIIGGQHLDGGSVWSIIHPTAALIVFGGTMSAVIVSYPVDTIDRAIRLAFGVFLSRNPPSYADGIDILVQIAYKIRNMGHLSIQKEIDDIPDHYMRKGLRLLADGIKEDSIRNIMEIELDRLERRDLDAVNVFNSAGAYAPTIGILGAVLGLIHVMENLSDPSSLGGGIAVAFVATVYGVGSANLFWLPISGKMKSDVARLSAYREMLMEGFCAISRRDHPRIIKESLEGYMRPDDRADVLEWKKQARAKSNANDTSEEPHNNRVPDNSDTVHTKTEEDPIILKEKI